MFQRTMRGVAIGGAIMFALAMSPTGAEAASIGFCENSTAPSGPDTVAANNGLCSKTVSLTGNQLTVTLANTTPAAFGGFITADAFFLPGAITPTLISATNSNFSLSADPSVNPFDNSGHLFNWLLSTGGDYEGGGSPSGGIAAGQSATFLLLLSSTTGLTEANFLSSEAIRFRGFANGGSDKDLVTTAAVPEPSTMLLLGAGVAGAGLRRYRRRLTS